MMFKLNKKATIILTLIALTGGGLAGCSSQAHHSSAPMTAKQKENREVDEEQDYETTATRLGKAFKSVPSKYNAHVQVGVNQSKETTYVMVDTGQTKDHGNSPKNSDVTAKSFNPVNDPEAVAKTIWSDVHQSIEKQGGSKKTIPVDFCYRRMTGVKHVNDDNTEPDNEDQYKDTLMFKTATNKATLSTAGRGKVLSTGDGSNA